MLSDKVTLESYQVSAVNLTMRKLCAESQWKLIDHSNINADSHLNRSGLHLNSRGTLQLARNFMDFISKRDKHVTAWEPDRPSWGTFVGNIEYIEHKPFGRGMVMTALNINSLVAHIDELRVFMSSSEIDILAINETKLNLSLDNNEIHLQGFAIVRKDRLPNGRNGGGIIHVRDILNYIIRDDLSPDSLECLRGNVH